MEKLTKCERHAPELNCRMERPDCVGMVVETVPTAGASAGTDFGSTDTWTIRITQRFELPLPPRA